MHLEVLSSQQLALMPKLSTFGKQFYLVGGTAIALQIGHRYSIDFDLFTPKSFNQASITKKLLEKEIFHTLLFKNSEGIHLLSDGVKITFFEYPFPIEHKLVIEKPLTMPSLLDLAAMKAYALGRRSKWKDYVDMYFLLKSHYSFQEICDKADRIFGTIFSKKLFKVQLAYFDDIDYSEPVDYLNGYETEDATIKQFLSNIAFEAF